MDRRPLLPLAALGSLLLGACTSAPGTLLEQSCGGGYVARCDPYEYAVVTEASVAPASLPPGDFSREAEIHVTVASCEEARPAPVRVDLSALVGEDPDRRVVFLATLRDDGSSGDAAAGDDRIDVTIVNPFESTVPAGQALTLRFEPHAGAGTACAGETFDFPYRTGR